MSTGDFYYPTSIKDFKSNSLGEYQMFVQEGNYYPQGNMQLDNVNALEIRGAGIDRTVLHDYGIIKNNNSPSDCIILRDLTIDLGRCADRNALNFVSNSKYFQLERVRLINSSNRFLFHWGNVDNLVVKFCEFYDAGLDVAADNCAGGQKVDSYGKSIFEDNLFMKEFSVGSALLTTGQTGDLVLNRNKFIDKSGLAYAGVSIESQTGDSKDIDITNNKFYDCGINIGVTTNQNKVGKVSIINNRLEGVTRGGIAVKRAKEVYIQDNKTTNTVLGVFVADSDYADIFHNRIMNTHTHSPTAFKSDKAGIYLNNVGIAEVDENIVWDTSGTTPYGLRAVGTPSPAVPTQKLYIGRNRFNGPFTTRGVEIAHNFAKIECSGRAVYNTTNNLPSYTEYI